MSRRRAALATPVLAPVLKITEAELTKFYLDKQNFEKLKKEHDKLKSDIEKTEKALMKRMGDGEVIETTVYNVAIDRSTTKRNVGWKDVAIRLWNGMGKNGKYEAEQELENTPSTVYPHLVVEMKDPVI